MMTQNMRWPQLAAAFSCLGVPVAVVDLETTGGDMYRDRITEVAVLRFEGGQVSRHEWLVNPQQPISAFITRLTGIDDAMVADAPVFADLAAELQPLVRGVLLVAHNSRFDYTFLRHEFQRAGVAFAASALCTVQLSRKLYPQFHKHNLDSIIARCGIEVDGRHRAMSDVLALADFLEYSLQTQDVQAWLSLCRSLMNPPMLPTGLPAALSARLADVPDAHGVLLWRDRFGLPLALTRHEKAFSEAVRLLHMNRQPHHLRVAATVDYAPALGPLHAVQVQAGLSAQYFAGRPQQEDGRDYLTVQFAADEHQRLQARIVPLKNGMHRRPPNGLFVHKKKARQALLEWAQAQELCPMSLGVLPHTPAEHVPCPRVAVGQCDGACRHSEGIGQQNSRIEATAAQLPVSDWGRAKVVEIVETDALSGQSVVLRCAGGALALPDGRWYFDNSLPALLKAKFKLGKAAVKVLA